MDIYINYVNNKITLPQDSQAGLQFNKQLVFD